MKKIITATLLLVFSISVSFAQDDLFGTAKRPPRKGVVIAFNASLDMPGADMAKRFGTSYRIGPSVFYKTKKNMLFGIKADFIFGNQIREKDFLKNLKESNGGIIGSNGIRTGADFFERGYMIGIQGGKIFNLSKTNSDNGLMVLTSIGFMQHKILITNADGKISQLSGDYMKGYDRLSNGLFIEQYVGYNYFADNGLINFHIGLDLTAGFTQGRRNYLYDVHKPGNEKRFDLLFGIRGGWYIPVFKRKSEEFFFE